eukprot:TRINITY_DN28198_c0_g2_i1.p1 TRINITY_DN28198_c0_g2~~TRINITY_DN28198_c0_g2_i1.p1  ORF type:complete len:414 (-),score=82.86 TRINITY_DN28198_c0_g2_i1:75-1151(-)
MEAARCQAWQVSRASGFRSRLSALRTRQLPEAEQQAMDSQSAVSLQAGLDALTYVSVEFINPGQRSNSISVVALVDTGSTDCELRTKYIEQLQLDPGGGYTRVETAANRMVKTAMFQAVVRIDGCEAPIWLTPAEEDEEEEDDEKDPLDEEFGFSSLSDDAMLGRSALASLGLLVDCHERRLIPLPKGIVDRPSQPLFSGGQHVPLEVSNPSNPSRRAVVRALVDTGSTDIDLNKKVIRTLALEVDRFQGQAQFETAGGITIEAPIYRALVKMLGREASVLVSPSEEADDSEEEEDLGDEDGDEEALLGHDALAALGLLVDCRNRRLIAGPVPCPDEDTEEAGLKRRRQQIGSTSKDS